MNLTCNHCQKRYAIADEKVRGKSVKIRCKQCQHIITVEGPPVEAQPSSPRAEWEDEPTRVATLNPTDVWFAMVKGKQVGPLDLKGLEARVQSGDISSRTYMWKQGMADWKRAGDLPEMAVVLAGGGAHRPAPPVPMQDVAIGRETPTAAEPAPANGNGHGHKGNALDELFSDAHLPATSSEPEQAPRKKKRKEKKEEPAPAEDPFAALGDPSQAPAGEATRFFIAQAGVDKRNPPWKVGLFVVCLVGVPVGALYLLSELKIVPLEITRVDEQGRQVKESVFSAEGMSGLSDLLLGRRNKSEGANRRADPKLAAKAKKPEEDKPAVGSKGSATPSGNALADFYNDTQKTPVGPKVRIDAEVRATDTTAGGLDPEAAFKVVTQTMPAFQNCVEQELRKNPNLKLGEIVLVATIGSSGAVKGAQITRREIDMSSLGDCLKSRAKRMVFSSFSGDDETTLEIPLKLGVAM